MSNPQDEASLAALALVRQAIQYSDAEMTEGSVMDVVGPYLVKLSGPDDDADHTAALRMLLASLAQWAGVTYRALITAREGDQPSKQHLLAHLDEVERRLVTDPGAGT
jgi:hypothetical protein